MNLRANILWTVIFFCLTKHGWAQESYKFPIFKEGVYKITSQQAEDWGLGALEKLAIYGYPGMIPQTLDSSAFGGRQIPSLLQDEVLYFFLTAADQVHLEEDGPVFCPHLYTDTLYYGIKTGQENVLRLESNQASQNASPAQTSQEAVWYELLSHKKEEVNLLSSGRSWYGYRMLNGQSATIGFEGQGDPDYPMYLQATLLSQSLSEATFSININGDNWKSLAIAPIPNTTYGIKGREGRIGGYPPSVTTGSISLQVGLSTSDRNGMGYLKHLLVGLPRKLSDATYGTYYRWKTEKLSYLPQGIGLEIWDVSDFFSPQVVKEGVIPKEVKKVAMFSEPATPAIPRPTSIDQALAQNSSQVSLLIIAPPLLKNQAQRLANHKTGKGLPTQVVEVQQIYDAYANGNPDISAIRNFIADHHHQYGTLKNVLFFGKGTFDYKGKLGGRPNLVPTYTSRSSLNPLTTYSSDDYFGFVEYGQGEWGENTEGDLKLSIGVGRIPATTVAEAREIVNKIIAYENPSLTKGDWKRKVMLIADDGDNNIHLRDAESHASYLSENHPEFVLEKVYLDRFEQVNVGNAQRSPQAQESILEWVKEGGALINFIGHGNETTLTAEEIITAADIKDWPENVKLPIFVTATCEFGRHDSPFIRSGAEDLLFASGKGAIGLLTTGRPVFSSINFSLNKAFIEAVFTKAEGEYLSLGEIFMLTKNNSLNGPLNRNFSLLGDPSLRIPLPSYQAQPKELQDVQMELKVDTLKAMQRIRVEGRILDPLTGALIDNFEGKYELSIADKPIQLETLGDESPVTTFSEPNVYLFRGKGSVKNGQFTSELLMPKQIQFQHEKGVVRIFAKESTGNREAMGAERLLIGGTYAHPEVDQKGPQISVFVQDSSRNEFTTSSRQVRLILGFEDKAGINISTLNLAQQLTLTLNEDSPKYFGNYFYALEGGNKVGIADFELRGLEEGINEVRVQAFDNLGNRSEKRFQIEVRGSDKIILESFTAYPNPASEKIRFKWWHNRAGENLVANLRIFSVSGHEIFSMVRRFPNATAQLDGLEWFFLHNKTNYPIKGTYLYRVELQSEADGSVAQKGGKIIIQ
ncbi:type IX secretion system sortase PorU [Pleomorphovibrio marinus]|uniref:type IX secretion system sortase PorU n=1 Tax=Pleomorphovibrio marinus TaxID=2164132 RepID=UPI0013005661|nr:type IX secretion system sortase PorU [Pleomorphovibrio marinus]